MQTDLSNIKFQQAAQFVNGTSRNIFITGKAGTGKTTFLKHIRKGTHKNIAVVAPTGVAAINAEGTTIHSFFSLPFTPFLPQAEFFSSTETTSKEGLIKKMRLTKDRRDIMRKLDLLVIDEISMVRCDVLDAIDTILRHVRRNYTKPFGGVQVLFIGDLYQLPPVVKQEEWDILKKQYENPFYFSSKVVQESPPLMIELEKVYRQSDEDFLDLLNQIRHNKLTADGYEQLKKRQVHKIDKEDKTIILTTHNAQADKINSDKLNEIKSAEKIFEAEVIGDFPEKNYPAEYFLKLKSGAQVMFNKNDSSFGKKYYNGKIGTVKSFEDDKIIVVCDDEDIEVKRQTWTSIQYSLNEKTNIVEENELGSFTQFPLQLAWAITIHKSQGLTFDSVAIDAGRAFSPGQVYVALSRCRSLDGIKLLSPIGSQSLFTHHQISHYSENQFRPNSMEEELNISIQAFQQEEIISIFHFDDAKKLFERLHDKLTTLPSNSSLQVWLPKLEQSLFAIYSTAEKFRKTLPDFFNQEFFPFENTGLQNRIKAAANWFNKQLIELLEILKSIPVSIDNRQTALEINERLELLYQFLLEKKYFMQEIEEGISADKLMMIKRNFNPIASGINTQSTNNYNLPDSIIHPDLFMALRDLRNQICIENDTPAYMVCSSDSLEEMSNFLPTNEQQLMQIKGFGRIKVKQFGEQFLEIINDYMSMHDLKTEMNNKVSTKKKSTQEKSDQPKEKKIPSKEISFALFKEGKTIDEIAEERNFAKTTICGHLVSFVESGEIDIKELLSEEKIFELNSVLENMDDDQPKYGQLPNGIVYHELKWMIAYKNFIGKK